MQARFELTTCNQLGEWVTHMRGTNHLSLEEPFPHQASQTLLTALHSLTLLPQQRLPVKKQVPALYNKPLTICHVITCIIFVEILK